MTWNCFSARGKSAAVQRVAERLRPLLNLNLSLRLWDGTVVPLGEQVDTPYQISLESPGVIGALLRRPRPENLLRLYASGQIGFSGDLINIGQELQQAGRRIRGQELPKMRLLLNALPFILDRPRPANLAAGYQQDHIGRSESQRSNRDYIQFHYDVSNEFYALFLDPEMQYSCAYFTEWGLSLEEAQLAKLEMICRKLRLQPGERFLDIGCGWGGLLCYAARNFGVKAHGITLSRRQYEYAQHRIEFLGLADQVSVAICDYRQHEGQYDKIASIGMFEHIGVANFPHYFRKINELLRDRGLLLNHGIARRAKDSHHRRRRIRPERQLLLKYIFPGSELAPIGHTVSALELGGFEVHDVEAWREHYAQTCQHWCRRLSARQEDALTMVGPERLRLWLAYLAGVAFGFANGSMKIYQVLASKQASQGPSGLPPTRKDLYD